MQIERKGSKKIRLWRTNDYKLVSKEAKKINKNNKINEL